MTTEMKWMIYGANGYTGRLVAELAAAEGLIPVLAGRREAAVRPLAEKLGLERRIFGLDDPGDALDGVRGMSLVLHAAGPFSATSGPMVGACLAAGAHYLDITGEIEVFEDVFNRDARARAAGVVLVPGAGFDVAPTDCLAVALKERLPGAVELELAIAGMEQASPGTLKTVLAELPRGGKVRRNGKLLDVPAGSCSKEIPFPHRKLRAMSIPGGDLFTAYRSTAIPNITVYLAAKRPLIWMSRLSRPLHPLFGAGPVQSFLRSQIDKRVHGPTEEDHARLKNRLWGRVSDPSGESVEGTAELPEAYSFTATVALAAVRRVLEGRVPPGAWTPAQAFGADFVKGLPGVSFNVPG